MTQKAYSLTRIAVMWLAAGVGFNVSQRILDHVLDGAFGAIPLLAWLNN